jgi:hypothetical protein
MPSPKEQIQTFTSATQQSKAVHTILQCFVDQNLETNENLKYSYILPKISFENNQIDVNEGTSVIVNVSLDFASYFGIEEVDIYYVPSSASESDVNISFSLIEPLRLVWEVGEQTKSISLSALTDSVIEGTEKFYFQLKNPLNSNLGIQNKLTINILNVS